MKFATPSLAFRPLSILVTCAALAACGSGSNTATSSASLAGNGDPGAVTSPLLATNVVATTSTSASAAAITDVRFQNTGTVAQINSPFTFGQVFVSGQINSTDVLSGRLDDGTVVPLQVDVKATNPDGSVRHAIISGILPTVAANAQRTMTLLKGGMAPAAAAATVSTMLKSGFTTSFHANINGVDYFASADDLLKTTSPTTWLKGGVANEWQVSAPLRTAAGVQHPHLSARFAVRWYDSIKKARVDVTVENDWAYEPSPQNFTYDASILVGGNTVYSQANMNHLNHARWRKIYWFNGTEPSINIKHNVAYLISTRALPNYDQSLNISESALSALQGAWNGVAQNPMGTGLTTPYMPMTGGRGDIGLLPAWAATYLLTQDSRIKEMTLRTADLAGSFSSHYRDKTTGRPVSLADHPYMTILGHSGDTFNPATGKFEAFPDCGGDCSTPNTHDTAHQPNLAYLPYLVTGDYYYLEELQFWGMWDAFSSNPSYRGNIKGLVQPDQVRGQGWSMRTLGEAAYISPDKDSLKTAFNNIVSSNLDWFNDTYTNNASANKLGVLVNGYALSYANETAIAPWQDDFFTSAIGHLSELGFTKASPLLTWKAQYPVSRMVGIGACYIDAAMYTMIIRSSSSSPFITNIGDAFTASHGADMVGMPCATSIMANYFGLQIGEMTGYSSSAVGYPSNLQPALAYSSSVSGVAGKLAWALFAARANKPDYSTGPQFDIVPR